MTCYFKMMVLLMLVVSMCGVSARGEAIYYGHYNGNTGNGGLDLDYAAPGLTAAINTGVNVGIDSGGKFGQALSADGSASGGSANLTYLSNAAGGETLDQMSGREGTISFWLKPTWAINEGDVVHNLVTLTGTAAGSDIYRFWIYHDPLFSRLKAEVRQANGTTSLIYYDIDPSDWTTDEYMHIAFAWKQGTMGNPGTSQGALYLNGTLGGFSSYRDWDYQTPVDQLGISVGSRAVGYVGFDFNGLLDELIVSNTYDYAEVGYGDVGSQVFDVPTTEFPYETELLEGDANRDGVVSAGDYASVQANFGSTGDPGILGDANGDGVVSAGDYASVQANFGNTSSGATVVPEPMTISLLIFTGIGVSLRRKRK